MIESVTFRRQRATALVALAAGVLLGIGGTIAVVRAQEEATPPSAVIAYQGYLEEGGVSVDGPRWLTFRLYRDAEGGEPVWSETHRLGIAGGRFTASLGSINSLDEVLSNGSTLHVEVSIDKTDGSEAAGEPVVLEGRQLLGSAPFARRGTPGKPFTADYLLVAPEQVADEGGEVKLEGAAGHSDVRLDNYKGAFRVQNGETVGLEVDAEGNSTTPGVLTRRIQRAHGVGPRELGNSGAVESRTLTFTKRRSDTAVRVTYSDTFRAAFSGGACSWEVRFDGSSCADPGPLRYDLNVGGDVNIHRPGTVVGTCFGLGSGVHTVQVFVGLVTTYPEADCDTGWDGGYWSLEAEEVF